LLRLRLLLLRVAERVQDLRRNACLLEGLGQVGRVEERVARGRLRVRQQHAGVDLAAASAAAPAVRRARALAARAAAARDTCRQRDERGAEQYRVTPSHRSPLVVVGGFCSAEGAAETSLGAPAGAVLTRR